MSTYLDSVSIAGVGGIPNKLALDLTAPLTLIYAPNGTGKTSSWNAMRALLTRGITEDIICQSPNTLAAELSGILRVNGVRYEATAEEGKISLRDQFGDTFAGPRALSILAPEVNIEGVQTRGGVLRDRLISQIQGCRFLPAESLLYLIDNSDDSTELRRRLFADLTGTSAVQTEVRETLKYRDRLAGELTSLERDIEMIDKQLDEFDSSDSSSAMDPVDLVRQAAQLVGVAAPSGTTPQALAFLRELGASVAAEMKAKRGAWNDWQAVMVAHPNLDTDLVRAKEAQREANALREQAELTLSTLNSQVPRSNVKALSELKLRLSEVSGNVAAVLEQGEEPEILKAASVAHLRRTMEQSGSEFTIQSKIDRILAIDAVKERYRLAVNERGRVMRRLEELSASEQRSSSSIQAELVEKQLDRKELEDRIVELMDSMASLRTMAESLVEESQTSICPCCSHRWSTVDELMAAIALPSGGSANDDLKKRLGGLDDAINRLRDEQHKALLHEDERRQASDRISEINRFIADTERSAQSIQVSPDRLMSGEDLAADLGKARLSLHTRRILDALDSIASDVQLIGSVSNVLADLSSKANTLGVEIAQAQKAQLDFEESVRQTQRDLATQLESARRRAKEVEDLARLASQRNAAQDRLRAGGVTTMEDVPSLLEAEEDRSLKLESLLTQIDSSIDVTKTMQVRGQIEANREELRSRAERTLSEVQRAEALLKLLTDFEAGAGERFFDRLGPAVATLFDHMQVNRVFKKIELRAVRESFSLSGQLEDDVSLDPKAHFSKGQCQDLALSMFLVRAASLGGTFFLDEPLAHLDDLNRTALLDCLRACVIGSLDSIAPVRLVVTTANWSVARHMMQKFYSVPRADAGSLLRVIQLEGNVRSKVHQSIVYPAKSGEVVSH
jgi:hypothetical protein